MHDCCCCCYCKLDDSAVLDRLLWHDVTKFSSLRWHVATIEFPMTTPTETSSYINKPHAIFCYFGGTLGQMQYYNSGNCT